MKKYRLEIPEEVQKRLISTAYQLSSQDGKEIDIGENAIRHDEGIIWVVRKADCMNIAIPESWLTEIKEEPKTFDEWFDTLLTKNAISKDTKGFMRLCHEWTKENERLKHKPNITMDQYISLPSFELKNIDKERFKQGWKACLESHNLED